MRPRRLQYNAPVVLTFSLLSLGALIFGMLTGGGSTRLLFCVYRAPLTDPLTYVRMFTHVLGHANLSTTRIYIVTTGTEHKRKMERMQLIL